MVRNEHAIPVGILGLIILLTRPSREWFGLQGKAYGQ